MRSMLGNLLERQSIITVCSEYRHRDHEPRFTSKLSNSCSLHDGENFVAKPVEHSPGVPDDAPVFDCAARRAWQRREDVDYDIALRRGTPRAYLRINRKFTLLDYDCLKGFVVKGDTPCVTLMGALHNVESHPLDSIQSWRGILDDNFRESLNPASNSCKALIIGALKLCNKRGDVVFCEGENVWCASVTRADENSVTIDSEEGICELFIGQLVGGVNPQITAIQYSVHECTALEKAGMPEDVPSLGQYKCHAMPIDPNKSGHKLLPLDVRVTGVHGSQQVPSDGIDNLAMDVFDIPPHADADADADAPDADADFEMQSTRPVKAAPITCLSAVSMAVPLAYPAPPTHTVPH